MDTKVENLLSELVMRTSKHFNMELFDALAAVAQSGVADALAEKGNPDDVSIEELSDRLFYEISHAV